MSSDKMDTLDSGLEAPRPPAKAGGDKTELAGIGGADAGSAARVVRESVRAVPGNRFGSVEKIK